MKKLILFTFIFILSINLVFSQNYPKLRNFVTDNANIIDDVSEAQLNSLAQQIEQTTTVEIAIVTVNSLENLDIETYAVELFEKAGIGKKDIDNGLLILIAPTERVYRIEVGFGLEGIITDLDSRQIGVKTLEPFFQKGEFGKGLIQATLIINEFVANNEEVISKFRATYKKRSSFGFGNLIYLIFFIMFIASSIGGGVYGKNRRRRMGFMPLMFLGFGGGFNRGGIGGSSFGGFGGGFSGSF